MRNATPHSTAQSSALSGPNPGDDGFAQAHSAWCAEEKIRLKAARAIDCGIPGCDHDLHDDTPMDEQIHRVSHVLFDDGEVELELNFYKGTFYGDMWLEGIGSEMTPAELRAKADLYESLPSVLREQANRLEALLVGKATA